MKMRKSHAIQERNTDKTESMPRANKLAHRIRNASRLIDLEQLDFELESGVGWNDRWESTSTIRLFGENTDQPPAAWRARPRSKLT